MVAGDPVAFCHLDLDNFKAYSDRYGYARGSEVIKFTARVLERVVGDCGEPNRDFIGHIGGDDFVLLTEPKRHEELCQEVIRRFGEGIVGFYEAEDLRRGYIVSKGREDRPGRFPILSISIAVVTNRNRVLKNPMEVGEAAARLKESAKAVPGGVVVTDGREREGVRERS